ncbi:MAG: hypothetical protein AB1630_05155 [bacterium]
MQKDGLFVPREYLKDFGEIELIEKPLEVIIKPKSMTQKTAGILKSKLDVVKLHKDYELTGGDKIFEAK